MSTISMCKWYGWGDIIDPIHPSNPWFTIYVHSAVKWYWYNQIFPRCHRSHLVPSDVGSFFMSSGRISSQYYAPCRVRRSRRGWWGYCHATSVLASYMQFTKHLYLLAIYECCYDVQTLLLHTNLAIKLLMSVVVVVVVVVDSVYWLSAVAQ